MSNPMRDFVIAQKREDRGEFFINLFEWCNLNCSFCWQDHSSKEGLDSVVLKSSNVIEVLERDFKKYQAFDINIMGGELFFDDVDDQLFEDYFQFVKVINDYALFKGIDLYYNWVTNFIFTKTERLKKLLNRLYKLGVKTGLTTSYDPRGRFNSQTYNLFKDNLGVFADDLRSIGIVMTKPNIKAIMKGDGRLKYLYQNYELYFDYYSPEDNFKYMLPLESELFEFFQYMLVEYPKSQPFCGWLEQKESKMTCRSSSVILPNGQSGQCRSLLNDELYKHFDSKVNIANNESMEADFINKRDCLSCEYFKICGLGCFLQSNFKPHQDLDDCLFYKTFEYISDLNYMEDSVELPT